jgi:hypothetical protein
LKCLLEGCPEYLAGGFERYHNDSGVIALVDGPQTNKTLKILDLSVNSALSQSGGAAITIGYNVLRKLILLEYRKSVGAHFVASSVNRSLEKLDLDSFCRDEGSETFRAL